MDSLASLIRSREKTEPLDIYPLVVRVNKLSTITIEWKTCEDAVNRILCRYLENLPDTDPESEIIAVEMHDGVLSFTHEFPEEGEYSIQLQVVGQDGSLIKDCMEVFVYAVNDDLFGLRPMRGDFHIHTVGSDGQETPEQMMACCRMLGFDFLAITDHHKYEPSLLAMELCRKLDLDIACFPGEEVHLPDNPVHIVNFGSSFSVNQLMRDDTDKYRAEVWEKAKELPPDTDKVTAFQVAASEWAFDKIREGGGIAMFCHPYWVHRHLYYISRYTNDLMMQRNKFDVYELFGGCTTETNFLQLGRWTQHCAQIGHLIPVAGVSDAHTSNYSLGWSYTVLFAKSTAFNDIADAIRDFRSLAVYELPNQYPIIEGPFRLQKYAYFLYRCFFPKHNAACTIEGQLVLDFIKGKEPDAPAKLKARKGSVDALYRKYWAAD